jgi:tol-pal system protein YbgF
MSVSFRILVIGLFSLIATEAFALFGTDDLDRRVTRLEQIQNSASQSDMVMQMERLQREVQQLRGVIETLTHAQDALKRQMQERFADLEGRMGGGASAATMADEPSSTPSDPPPLSLDNSPRMPSNALQQSQPERMAPISQSRVADPHQEAAYQAAIGQLKAGKYKMATQSFKRFLSAYPNGPYADNAQYWLGEASYADLNRDDALAEFDKLVRRHPSSPKVPDALLKQGYIQYDKRNWSSARAMLNRVVKDYPASSAAGLARKRLDQIKQEGH